MPTLLDKARQAISRHAMLSPGDHIAVAVSGGADSICLLHVLLELRPEFSLNLSIVHLDHNLRGPESQADADFVRLLAQQLSLPFHFRQLDLAPLRSNLEQEGRRARYAFFREIVAAGFAQKIALGHTRSDQAETVLFRLLRGSGSAGLAGIRPVASSPPLIRPLLDVARPEVEAWLRDRDIPWREDRTNADLRFDRNRLRHHLIPVLQRDWNPALPEILAQTADWAFEEEHYWQAEIPRLTADWVRFDKCAAILDCGRLNALPIAVVRRVLRYCVTYVKHDLLGIAFDHIETLRSLATQTKGAGRVQLPGLEVLRSFNWLRFERCPAVALPRPAVSLAVPGKYAVPPLTIELELLPYNPVYNKDVNSLDWDSIGSPLVLRGWRPGDRYWRLGSASSQKLKMIFQESRIPSWERPNWPVMTAGDLIVWTSRFGPMLQAAVTPETRTVLRIRETPSYPSE